MCVCAPAGAFSEPKIATLGFFAPKIVSCSVFNTEMRSEGPFPADFDSKRLFLFHPLRDEPTRMDVCTARRGVDVERSAQELDAVHADIT